MSESTNTLSALSHEKFTIGDYYQLFNRACSEATAASLECGLTSLHGPSQNHILDIEKWIDFLENRLESQLLQNACKEYQLGLFAAAAGLYRYAFMGLRLYYELALSAIYLSASEIELRLRLLGQRDVTWSEIVNSDNGLFSHKMARAFCPLLRDEVNHQLTLAKKLYRECSEYVHGTPLIEQPIPENIQFDEKILRAWHKKSGVMKTTVVFALFMRYHSSITPVSFRGLEACVLEEIGTIESVRILIDSIKRSVDA